MNVVPPRPCQRVRPLLDAYLSNELLMETSLEVMHHLEHCPECSAELNAKGEVRERLRLAVRATQVPVRSRFYMRMKLRVARYLKSRSPGCE